MKSTWFSKRSHYEFAKLVDDAGGSKGFRTYELFSSFLALGFASYRQAVNIFTAGKPDAALEEEYKREAARYPAPGKFAEAMGRLAIELEAEPHDFLGDVYQALGMADKDFAGQCFTPAALCAIMVEMTLGADIAPDPSQRLTISEPACGGGAMAIAAAMHLRRRGFGPNQFMLYATDIATSCFHMSYIQLTLLDIPAIVTHGNSLSLETRHVAPTFCAARYPMMPWQRKPEPERMRLSLAQIAMMKAVRDTGDAGWNLSGRSEHGGACQTRLSLRKLGVIAFAETRAEKDALTDHGKGFCLECGYFTMKGEICQNYGCEGSPKRTAKTFLRTLNTIRDTSTIITMACKDDEVDPALMKPGAGSVVAIRKQKSKTFVRGRLYVEELTGAMLWQVLNRTGEVKDEWSFNECAGWCLIPREVAA